MTKKILIVGGQGKTGSRVQSRLQAVGIETICVSRSTEPAFDWTKPECWADVLTGIDAAYLTYHPDLSVPEAEGHIRQFCELAKEAGVQQITLLSGRGEAGATRAEEALKESGLSWNIVQASWFAQNFSEDFMLDQVLAGELIVPAGCAKEPFIDIDDLADVVVATLLEPGLKNRLFEVTGPECLSFAECMAEISTATGRTVSVIELPLDEYIDSLRSHGVPEYLTELLQDLFGQLFDGHNAFTADGIREALGRPATTFAEYARKTAQTGIWSAANQEAS